MAGSSGTPRGYRYEWALFADWCAAADVSALPASPMTVASFLVENPAGAQAQRRRVAVINHVHIGAGVSAPGTVTAIRLQLDHTRTARATALQTRVAPIINALPVIGWPTGMFGRRDALILALRAAGLRAADIARLDRRDIRVVGDGVYVGDRHQLNLISPAGDESAIAYATVWRRWEQVLEVLARHPSPRVLAHHLRTGTFPDHDGETDGGVGVSGPVVVPIDRWGAVPLQLVSMTPAAVAAVWAAHLTGTPAPHRPIPDRADPRGPLLVTEPDAIIVGGDSVAAAWADTHAAGVAARAAAHNALADVAEVLGDVEDRAEELLRRTLALLDGT